MNAVPILDSYRNQLAEHVLARGSDLPRFDPLNISPWLGMSLMQKAIRRGREGYAFRSAATLLSTSPERLWRRLNVTAFECIAPGSLDTSLSHAAGLSDIAVCHA